MSVTNFLIDFKNRRVYEIGKYPISDAEEILSGKPWTEQEFCDLWLKRATTAPFTRRGFAGVEEDGDEVEVEPVTPEDLARSETFARQVYAFCVEADWHVEVEDEYVASHHLEENLFVYAGSCYHLSTSTCPGCGQPKESCDSVLDPTKHGALLFEVQAGRPSKVLVPIVDLFFLDTLQIVLFAETEVCEQFELMRFYKSPEFGSDFENLMVDIEGPDDRVLKIVAWGPLAGDKSGKFAIESQEKLRETLGEDWLHRFKIFPKRLQGAHRMPKPKLEVIAGGKS